MGRRSINTTKSGKYMNPTDQARKSLIDIVHKCFFFFSNTLFNHFLKYKIKFVE